MIDCVKKPMIVGIFAMCIVTCSERNDDLSLVHRFAIAYGNVSISPQQNVVTLDMVLKHLNNVDKKNILKLQRTDAFHFVSHRASAPDQVIARFEFSNFWGEISLYASGVAVASGRPTKQNHSHPVAPN